MKRLFRKKLTALLELSHELGREDWRMALLGEGNTSARLGADTFLVKASGSRLATLQEQDVVECNAAVLLALLDQKNLSDAEIEAALLASRVDPNSKKPSVEALFHAYCLTLPNVEFVGHTHAVAVNQILCSPRAREFATKRIFPDEIVFCGSAAVFVPYTDPGLRLAQAIRRRTEIFMRRYQQPPRVILLENHGLITLGRTPEAVLAAMVMAEKTAMIWVGAAALGGPKFLSKKNIWRIAGRSDEHYRQRMLNV
ncbi:MAG: class II aldolase/adducin family protein [candidate division KSB1 bacterium]|nr:class II aldolase/adducin family protein [candidate division KSB1 bacterium]MDZ7303026.1 class II aldolase/adducin family protein [candidate division KSB1 bacterium]MDZ7312466.1 class II aldolase/adducin family protein [candidate division KSB1 bacterium]